MYVRKPIKVGSEWIIEICESRSPLSKIIESIKCRGREEAWQNYIKILGGI